MVLDPFSQEDIDMCPHTIQSSLHTLKDNDCLTDSSRSFRVYNHSKAEDIGFSGWSHTLGSTVYPNLLGASMGEGMSYILTEDSLSSSDLPSSITLEPEFTNIVFQNEASKLKESYNELLTFDSELKQLSNLIPQKYFSKLLQRIDKNTSYKKQNLRDSVVNPSYQIFLQTTDSGITGVFVYISSTKFSSAVYDYWKDVTKQQKQNQSLITLSKEESQLVTISEGLTDANTGKTYTKPANVTINTTGQKTERQKELEEKVNNLFPSPELTDHLRSKNTFKYTLDILFTQKLTQWVREQILSQIIQDLSVSVLSRSKTLYSGICMTTPYCLYRGVKPVGSPEVNALFTSAQKNTVSLISTNTVRSQREFIPQILHPENSGYKETLQELPAHTITQFS